VKIFKNICNMLMSEIRLRKKRVAHNLPVYISDGTKLQVGKNVFIGRNCYLDANEIILHDGVSIGKNCKLIGGTIVIGRHTNINSGCNINVGKNTFHMGNFCAISRNISFWGVDHNLDLPAVQVKLFKKFIKKSYPFKSKGGVLIGNDVLIGEGCIILCGAKISDGAIIGAGSVVTKEIPAYVVAAGHPAEYIRSRFKNDIVDKLLLLKWWDWSDEKILTNSNFFECNLKQTDSTNEFLN